MNYSQKKYLDIESMICPNCKSSNVRNLYCSTAHICCSCGFHWETSLIEELENLRAKIGD